MTAVTMVMVAAVLLSSLWPIPRICRGAWMRSTHSLSTSGTEMAGKEVIYLSGNMMVTVMKMLF